MIPDRCPSCALAVPLRGGLEPHQDDFRPHHSVSGIEPAEPLSWSRRDSNPRCRGASAESSRWTTAPKDCRSGRIRTGVDLSPKQVGDRYPTLRAPVPVSFPAGNILGALQLSPSSAGGASGRRIPSGVSDQTRTGLAEGHNLWARLFALAHHDPQRRWALRVCPRGQNRTGHLALIGRALRPLSYPWECSSFSQCSSAWQFRQSRVHFFSSLSIFFQEFL